MTGNYKDNADVFKALGDENRLKILELLKQGEKCGNEILEKVKISQSTLSHHMKVMCISGIIKSRKEGTWTYYSINNEGAFSACKLLAELTLPKGYVNNESVAPSSHGQEVKTDEKDGQPEDNKEAQHKQSGARPNGWLL